MTQEQLSAKSPIYALRQFVSGGVGAGKLGVTMARAGVGKTAFLVQIGLDALLQNRNVLHVACGQNIEHVRAWYDTLFDDLAGRHEVDSLDALQTSLARHLVIQTYGDNELTTERLQQAVDMYRGSLQFSPDLILLDGFDWENPQTDRTRAALESFLACAAKSGSELWMSAQTHRAAVPNHPVKVTPPCAAFEALIGIVVFLEPEGQHVSVRILKDHDKEVLPETNLLISCDTLSLAIDVPRGLKLPPSAYTLLSGSAPGAETAFGECAEQWGLQEINFSFEGHKSTRHRGLVKLSAEELELGHVTEKYILSHMHRSYPRTPLFQRVLQSIWHQVNTAGEVFVVGRILDDGTIKGGTGWAAELGRHWHKRVCVFDQGKDSWFTWRENSWAKIDPPLINRTRFTGTGTRFLNDRGGRAIRELFKRSFG